MKRKLAQLGFSLKLPRCLEGAHRLMHPFGYFRVLAYHHVLPDPDPFLPHLCLDDFSAQIDYLVANYRIRPLAELVAALRAGRRLHPAELALTFDDGYADFAEVAWPFLRKRGIPATVFVPTGFIDTDRLPWSDELGFLFRHTPVVSLNLELGGENFRVSWSGEFGKQDAFARLKVRLKNLPGELLNQAMAKLRTLLEVGAHPTSRVLTSEQIRRLAAEGVEFGSHTVDHVIVGKVGESVAAWEIFESRRRLKELLGRAPAGFCYPNGQPGDYNETTDRLVREAGYEFACLTVGGINARGACPYHLRRGWTGGVPLESFAARLALNRLK